MRTRTLVLLVALAAASATALVALRIAQRATEACPSGICPRVLPAAASPGAPSLAGRVFAITRSAFLRPASLGSAFIPAIAREITQAFFLSGPTPCPIVPRPAGPLRGPRGPYEPDITTIDITDPKGGCLRRSPSSFTLGSFPPIPLPPPDFRVEKLEQKGRVEENPAPAQLIGPQNVGPGRFP